MSLLSVSGLAFRHSSQSDFLFRNVGFAVNPKDRIGLIGPNGSGKSTLLRLLTGEIQCSTGEIAARNALTVGYIPQQSAAPTDEKLDTYLLDSIPELANLRREMRNLESSLEVESNALRYAELLDAYQAANGYGSEALAEKILEGLGFDERERGLKIGELSGGQRTRMELAKLLLIPSDVILLDEPTNHLDLKARSWLEDYLSRIDQAYIAISHDRAFLDSTAERIFDLRRGELTVYEGGYKFYQQQRALSERQAWQRYEGQERRNEAMKRAAEQRVKLAAKVAKAPAGVRSSRDFYQAKAARVLRTSRILKERKTHVEQAQKPWTEDPIRRLSFFDSDRSGKIALRAEGVSKSFDDKTLFRALDVTIHYGERWAILGPNGSGKTTLLRIIKGLDMPDEGRIEWGARVRVGYFAQEGEDMNAESAPLEICKGVCSDETKIRTVLACLKLGADRVNRSIGSLSAGERAKVAIAKLLLEGTNLLLLDEPTNHLDIEAREALESTLKQFPGAIIFVSHDRRFIDELADNLIEL